MSLGLAAIYTVAEFESLMFRKFLILNCELSGPGNVSVCIQTVSTPGGPIGAGARSSASAITPSGLE